MLRQKTTSVSQTNAKNLTTKNSRTAWGTNKQLKNT